MDESILNSTKKLLGIPDDIKDFDTDIILHINSVFSTLMQLGAVDAFSITDDTQTWDELDINDSQLNFVKSYIYLKVRLLFDPPANGNVSQSVQNQISELEYRMTANNDLFMGDGE